MTPKVMRTVLLWLGWVVGVAAPGRRRRRCARCVQWLWRHRAALSRAGCGDFKKYNLNLEMIFIPGGSLSLQALIGKSLDVLMTGGPPVVNAYLQGAKIKIIGGSTNLLPYTFVAVGGIRTPEQLKGKEARYQPLRQQYGLRRSLGAHPVRARRHRRAGHSSRRVAGAAGGHEIRRDPATVLSPEESVVAQKMGYGILLDFIEKGIEFPHVNFVVRDDFLESQAANSADISPRLHRVGALLQNA